jgi:hypothetical protein
VLARLTFPKTFQKIGDHKMYKKFRTIASAAISAFGAIAFAAPAQAIQSGLVLNTVTCNSVNVFQWVGPPGNGADYCPDGVDPALSNTSKIGTRTFTLFSAVNLPTRAADVIDLNSVLSERASEVLGIDRAALVAIRETGASGAFANAEDFAIRVCSKTAVTIRAGAIRIGTTEYRSPPSRDPRAILGRRLTPVFSCVARSGTYEVVGQLHNYVGHVTLLR